MKYNININQFVLADTKLDLIDAAILDYLYFICNSRNKKIEKEGANKFTHNDFKIGDLYIGHYDKASKYSIANLIDMLGVSFIQGHDHRFSMFSKTFRDGRELIGLGQGCLCSLKPSYIAFPNWQQGFSVFYKKKDKNRFQVYGVRIPDYKFFFGDKEYNYDELIRL